MFSYLAHKNKTHWVEGRSCEIMSFNWMSLLHIMIEHIVPLDSDQQKESHFFFLAVHHWFSQLECASELPGGLIST